MKRFNNAMSKPKITGSNPVRGTFVTMITYIMTPEDIALAIEIGEARHNVKPDSIRETNVYLDTDDSAMPHKLGAAGEIAFARTMGLHIDRQIYLIRDMRDFGNCELKTATFQGHDVHLKVKSSEYNKKKPFAYFLARARMDLSSVDLFGFILREEFDLIKEEHRYTNRNPESNWVVPADQLNPLEWLINAKELLEELGFRFDTII